MSISGFFQFIFGFILGVLLLVAGSVGAAYYFFNRMASAPPKPVFSEQIPSTPVEETPEPAATETPAETTETETAEPEATETEETEEEAADEDELPEGAFEARVTWSSGLSLRAEPDLNASRIGGVDYNEELLVLEASDDGVWQKVRTQGGAEAWVKAGNVERLN
ncbi:SH3 domain-containing protein [[Limnothrix rosea] IAM M-220]|uniref:SH3 domain-containing protein n=1 Tax=[Limnothrix rosea] IAM M-220 TaxID=454133 RepID=UPI000958F5B1|nr:SH3 domain-containing protein [[Limnothrix rosea] IAM M-220]OKH19399.1 ligand-binding protein SH3 [[Limnothrix rosea] IAM M-220]